MILSILICSLRDRGWQLKPLLAKLDNQRYRDGVWGDVELLSCTDGGEKAGGMSIGGKRNHLLRRGSGSYVCFIDDDDDVSDDYVKRIVDATRSGPDCVGITGDILWRNKHWPFHHSIEYSEYKADDKAFYRPPNHLNPIKREIALKYPFQTCSWAEDHDFSMRMAKDGALETEVRIPHTIYWYTPAKRG